MGKFEDFFKYIDQEENKKLFAIAAWVTIIAALFVASAWYSKAKKKEELKVNLNPKTEVLDVFEVPGMKSRKVRVTPRGTILSVRLWSEPWCQEGDFDFIARDMEQSSSQRLLLSVEPLSPDSGFRGFNYPINLGTIRKGSKFDLMVPNTSVPVHLAVYICKDSAGSNTCADKEVFTAEQMHSNYMHSEAGGGIPDVPGEPQDKIYYFSYFMLEGDSISAVDNQMADVGYDDLEKYFKKKGASIDAAAQSRGIVESVNQRLKSKGLDLNQPELRINLPRMDVSTCGRPNKVVQKIGGELRELDIQEGKLVGVKGMESEPVNKGVIKQKGRFTVIKKQK